MSDEVLEPIVVSGWVVFANRDFRFYSIARFLSATSYQMQVVAVSWLVYDMTHSAFALGLVGLAAFLPAVGFALVTGHAADRFDRRSLLSLCYGAIALMSLGLMVFVLVGSTVVWPVFVIIFAIGTARAFGAPAGQALVPSLVPKHQFSNAIAWGSSIFQVATIIGPALGGLLYALGPQVVFGTAAAFLTITTTLMMSLQYQGSMTKGEKASWDRLVAGIHFIRFRPIIMGAISLDLFAVLLGGATALLPIYAKDILGTGPVGLGILRSMPAVGAVIFALAMTQWPLRRYVGKRMFYAVAVFGIATIGFGLSTNMYLSMACLFVLGAADMISVIVRQTLVQIDTPDNMRGRVAAVNTIFIGASNELGEFESGTLAALIGAVPTVVVGGIGTLLVAGIWTRLFPALWHRDRMSE